ncbi:MAG: RND family efflux transporter MFP subunit [Paraglaciecola sp.]|jgi:RND family efflux transporter MFP subunit
MLNKNVRHIIGLIGVVALLSGGLSGCDSANSQEVNTIIKPVKLVKVPDLNNQHVDSFIAKLDATERAVLSFNVAGEIASHMVRMGKQVKKGEVLAYLDPTDYQLALDVRQAEYDLAMTQYQRAKKLIKDTLISTDQFDQNETNFKVAQAKLAQARTDLTYTKIVAPFDGVVSLTNVESHQVVAVNQPVMKLLNNAVMDVIFTVPVSYIAKYGVDKISRAKVWVTMDNRRGLKIPARFKEISTQPNKDTNSFSARLTIRRPADLTLLSDMSGQVHLSNDDKAPLFSLPDTAWISRTKNKGHLWKFDQTEQRVTKIVVVLDEQGNITGGLNQGDLVVETGIQGLSEGQLVKAWVEEDGI